MIGISIMTMLFLWSAGVTSFGVGATKTIKPTTSEEGKEDTRKRDNETTTCSSGITESNNGSCLSSTYSPSPQQVQINPHPKDPSLHLYHFTKVQSTQDEAKRIISEIADDKARIQFPFETFVVTTREQTNGRGTSGRKWISKIEAKHNSYKKKEDDGASENYGIGNTFVTIGIPVSKWVSSQIPLTLLPLKIGYLVANQIQTLLDKYYTDNTTLEEDRPEFSRPMVTVKWPNDVLIDEMKASGVLIESHESWFLIGIGVNLASSPEISKTGEDYGRTATCLSNHVRTATYDDEQEIEINWEWEAHQLGTNLGYELSNILKMISPSNPSTAKVTSQLIINEWKSFVDWDMELVMRDTPKRERVKLMDVLSDGRVQVMSIEDGTTRTLVSDYFL